MKHKPIEKQSQAEFDQSLQARFAAAAAATKTSPGMHMTPAPTGQSRSLTALLQDDGSANALAATPPSSAPAARQDVDAERAVIKLDVKRIVDSPYQPRTYYDDTELIALSSAMDLLGQQEPIRVRRRADGYFELIHGHRRWRAAKLLGWEQMDGLVSELDDRGAQIATLTANEGNVRLSDYERGLAYEKALKDGLAQNQGDVARMFSCSQGRVSQCLSVVKLPDPIKDLLPRYPRLLTYRHAKVIKEIFETKAAPLEVIVAAVETMIDEPELEPQELRARCLTLAPVRGTRASPTKPKFVLSENGLALFTVRSNGNKSVVAFHSSLTAEQQELAEKQIIAALKQAAESFR